LRVVVSCETLISITGGATASFHNNPSTSDSNASAEKGDEEDGEEDEGMQLRFFRVMFKDDEMERSRGVDGGSTGLWRGLETELLELALEVVLDERGKGLVGREDENTEESAGERGAGRMIVLVIVNSLFKKTSTLRVSCELDFSSSALGGGVRELDAVDVGDVEGDTCAWSVDAGETEGREIEEE
jgi:hypothetical protein